MSKRYTVDETWELCLKMWKWISRQCKGKNRCWCERNVDRLKKQWLERNGYGYHEISQECFLCNRTTKKGDWMWNCRKCLAVKIDIDFDCMAEYHHFSQQPRLFYAELKRLNKIRLGAK